LSRARWRTCAIAVIAAITGGGIGHQAGIAGLGLASGLGVWVGLLGLGALLVLFLTARVGPGAPAPTSDDAGWIEFRRELRRARRGGQPLTILRIVGDELSSAGPDGRSDLATRARRLGLHLRLVDRTWVDDASIFVLLPDTSRAAADAAIGRIRAASPGQLPARVRIATFPEQGLTSGALIAAVYDGAVDAVPTPIRPTTGADVEAAAFATEEDLAVGEARS
jgi:hypothetical protein